MAKVFIEETTLTAIGDAIRGKEGSTALIPVPDMATRISAIQGGGGSGGGGGGDITAADLTFTGNLSNLFSYTNWNWVLNRYGHMMTFKNISNTQNMFYNNTTIEDLSELTIPFNNNTNPQSMFAYCNKLKKLPKVSGAIDRYFYGIFNNCQALSDDEINNFFTNLTIYQKSTSLNYSGIFSSCYSVRDLAPTLDWLHTQLNGYTGNSSSFVNYSNWFTGCNTLNALEGVPVLYSGTSPRTSNSFSSIISQCFLLKDFIFKQNDGVPYVVQWKSQTIDFTQNTGYVSYPGNLTSYNSYHGITEATRVTDDASYQALKDNPDWWTTDTNYCRYNHDSAVNTINSLPDTSAYLATAGGTNTIKFKGTAGSATEGGAINTLTAEEIAVATAKGWTVTLV